MKISVLSCVKDYSTVDLKVTSESLQELLGPEFVWNVWIKSEDISEFRRIELPFVPDSKLQYVNSFCGGDNGVYNAINKLLRMTEQSYVMVLGAGDSIAKAVANYGAFSDVFCRKLLEGAVNCFPVRHKGLNRVLQPSIGGLRQHMSVPHPGVIMHRRLFDLVGGFDERYRISADYDLVVRAAAKFRLPFNVQVTQPIVDFVGGGLSDLYADEAELENALIQLRSFPTERKRSYYIAAQHLLRRLAA